MKLNGKWTATVASACIMTVAGFTVAGVASTFTRTNDTDKMVSIEAIIEESQTQNVVLADKIAIEHNLLGLGNPLEEAKESESLKLEDSAEDIVIEESVVEESTVEEETTTIEEVETEQTPVSPYANKFMVNVDEYLNIRSEASENAEVLGKLYAGAGGDVLEQGAEWTKIQSGSVTGYVATRYLLFGADAEAKANEVGRWTVKITVDSLRVRKAAGTDTGVWGLVSSGETYTGIGYEGDFMGIYFEDEVGYVSKDYIEAEFVIKQAISIEEEQEQIRREEEARKAAEAERIRREQEAAAALERAAKESQFVQTVQTDAYDLTESDAYLLACLVTAEAGYEPYEGKLAVANVVLNRLRGGYYGNSISDVVYARGQFSVVPSGKLAKVITNGPNEESIRATQAALSGTNNVPNYGFFCSLRVANYGRYNNYSIIGNQVFYN